MLPNNFKSKSFRVKFDNEEEPHPIVNIANDTIIYPVTNDHNVHICRPDKKLVFRYTTSSKDLQKKLNS